MRTDVRLVQQIDADLGRLRIDQRVDNDRACGAEPHGIQKQTAR